MPFSRVFSGDAFYMRLSNNYDLILVARLITATVEVCIIAKLTDYTLIL